MKDYDKFKAVYLRDKSKDDVGTVDEYASMLGIGRFTVMNYKKKADAEQLETIGASLTEKERLFCCHYAMSMQPVQSYMKVYKIKRHGAVRKINSLLDRDDIIEYTKALRRNSKKTNALINIDDIISKYVDIVHADMTDYIDFGTHEVVDVYGNVTIENYAYFKPAEDVDGTLIKALSNRGGDVNILLEDRQKALAVLMDYKRLVSPDDNNITGNLKSIVAKISERQESEDSKTPESNQE